MAVNINLKVEKKHLYLLAAVLVFLAGVTYVIAYGATVAPSVYGHTASEIDGLGLGNWTNKATLVNGTVENITESHIYKAQTDGFLIGVITWATGDNQCYIKGYTDATNPPITVLGSASTASNYQGPMTGSFNMPVKKGDYFKVTYQADSGTSTRVYYWISNI